MLNLVLVSLENTYDLAFFSRPTLEVARDLLGSTLCRRLDDGTLLRAPIVEVEAYTQDDPACHAAKGLTPRCAVMFGEAGRAYVYFIYGMYFCLNVVTEPHGTPGAVLIRAIGGVNTNGPGKLCREWEITAKHNGANLMDPKSPLWIEKSAPVDDCQVAITQRIGITSAWERPWRFHIKDHACVSGPKNFKGGPPKPKLKKRARQ